MVPDLARAPEISRLAAASLAAEPFVALSHGGASFEGVEERQCVVGVVHVLPAELERWVVDGPVIEKPDLFFSV